MRKISNDNIISLKKILITIFILSVLFISASNLSATELLDIENEYDYFELDNGLKVMVFTDNSLPVFRFNIIYNLGSIDDPAPQSGISLYLNNLVVNGQNISDARNIEKIISKTSGFYYGDSGYNYTDRYYSNMKESNLELVIALEADRMQNLLLEPEIINNSREKVLNRRTDYLNNQFNRAFTELKKATFQNTYLENNYFGSLEDLENIHQDSLNKHYQKFYHPNNALISISGAVDKNQVRKLVERHFAKIEAVEIEDRNYKPIKQSEEIVNNIYEQNNIPFIIMLYNIVPLDNPDILVIDLILDILINNQDSRIRKRLQKEEGLISAAGSYIYGLKSSSFARIYLRAKEENDIENILRIFDEELELIFEEGFEEQEFEQAKLAKIKSFVFAEKNLAEKASRMGRDKLLFDNADLKLSHYQYLNKISQKEAVEIAKRYLKVENRARGAILSLDEEGEQNE